VQTVIVAKLDRLTRSVKDLCGLLELFEKKNVALVSVAESLDTSSAAGRLVGYRLAADGKHVEPNPVEQKALAENPAPPQPGRHVACDRRSAEPSGATDPPRNCLAARARRN